MTTFVRLNANFNNPDLPVIKDWRSEVSNISSLFSWYNSDEGNYETDTEGFIALTDLSGSGSRLVKPAARTAAPTISEGVINGKNALDVTIDGGLRRETDDTPVDNVTFFIVYIDEGDSSVNAVRWLCDHDSAPTGLGIYQQGDTQTLTVNSPGGSAIPMSDGPGPRAGMASFSGTTMYASESNDWSTVYTSTGHTGITAPGTFYVGQASSVSSVFQGKIAEVIILSKSITDASDPDLATISSYFSARYGI